MNKKSGTFIAKDSLNNPIILEWKEVQGHTDELAQTIRGLAEIFAPSYTQTEVEFVQKKPEDIPNDFMLKTLASLLEQGIENVDWDLFQQKTEDHLRQFFANTDWKSSSGAQDMHFFVVAKDESNKPLGAIQFFTTPDFEESTIKAALFGVIPVAQNRDLEKLLMSSIFRLLPDIRRIFLHTRSTNTSAINVYKKWGFTEFAGKLPNWTDLEYFADCGNILQTIAENLVIKR